MTRRARWIGTFSCGVALGFALFAGCAPSLNLETARDAADAAAVDATGAEDASNVSTDGDLGCKLGTWITRSPQLPPPAHRDDCASANQVVDVVDCEFNERSPAECAGLAADGGEGWGACRSCVFGYAPSDVASDAAPLPLYSTPVIVNGGFAWLNVGACLLLTHGLPDGGAPNEDQRCAQAYLQQQVCQSEVCADCRAQGAITYEACLAASIGPACPAVQQHCGLLVSDAGCDVLHNFTGHAQDYGLRFCL